MSCTDPSFGLPLTWTNQSINICRRPRCSVCLLISTTVMRCWDPTVVPKQFAYMLSYSKVLPEDLPDFYRYLLSYPDAKPANVENAFYWAKVKFGLKPTLRIVHMGVMRGGPADPVACAIAEKQLYSSHYFQTALDMSFCVRGNDQQSGFYLIMLMGSEQAGLTGFRGSIARNVAVGRSASNLRNALTTIKDPLEGKH
jgi:hypothetical protein